MTRKLVDTSAVEAEVSRITTMTKAEMRDLWRAKFKADPPVAFGRLVPEASTANPAAQSESN